MRRRDAKVSINTGVVIFLKNEQSEDSFLCWALKPHHQRHTCGPETADAVFGRSLRCS